MVGTNDSKLFYKTTGANIRKYRDLRNYSLQILAEKVGLTKKTIQRYENGEIKIDMNRLKDLSVALNVTVSQLTEGTDIFFEESEKSPIPGATEKRPLDDEINIEDLVHKKMVYKGHVLSEEEKSKLLKMLRALLD